MPDNAVKHKKMSFVIVERLIGMISSGELKPGDRLPPERQLAEAFHVSRATLREALSAMEVTGIIDMRVGEGTYVTNMDIFPFIQMISRLFLRDVSMEDELLELRKLLEMEAIRLIIQRDLPPSELDVLRKIVDRMEQSLFIEDVDAGVEADVQFHQTLFALSDSYILQSAGKCISSIQESSVRFNRSKILRDTNNMELLYNQHHLIYKALLQRDETMAMRMIGKHLDFVRQMI